MTPSVEELAPRGRGRGARAPRGRASSSRACSTCRPSTCKGIRRILTVSADTELISAPAYLRAAAARAGAQQLRLGRLDHPGRARARPHRLPAARRPRRRHERAHLRARRRGVQVPLRLRRAARLLARARDGQRALRPGRLRPALRRAPVEHVRARGSARWPRSTRRRPSTCATGARGSRSCAPIPSRRRASRPPATGCSSSRSSGSACPTTRKRHGIQLEYGFKGMTNDELRQAWMAEPSCRSWTRSASTSPRTGTTTPERWVIDCPFPARFDAERQALAARRGPDRLGRGAWSAGRAAAR